MVDDGLCLVSKNVWDDENPHNMTGDITTPEARRGGSEKPRRHHFGVTKNASTPLSKWKRVALSEEPTFSDFYDDSNEFGSDVSNHERVMRSECIIGGDECNCPLTDRFASDINI